ncbi:hypothetical protein EDD15DRAFT_2369952 [Pisolithus albus]|nr:hypothetical protein EDD15DRAFT_2369952 [Pisolithus albus]
MATSSTVSSLVSFARENNYEYLPGIPTSSRPEASWFIPPSSMTSHPIALGQRVLLVSLTSRKTFFGRLKSVVRLERSYVVVSVSPVEKDYGFFLPAPCNVYLSISSFILPKLRQLQYQLLSSTLSDRIHDDFEALLPALIGEDGPSSSSCPPEH